MIRHQMTIFVVFLPLRLAGLTFISMEDLGVDSTLGALRDLLLAGWRTNLAVSIGTVFLRPSLLAKPGAVLGRVEAEDLITGPVLVVFALDWLLNAGFITPGFFLDSADDFSEDPFSAGLTRGVEATISS